MQKCLNWLYKMGYSLKKTYESFEKEILQLNAIVNKLAATPESMERDVHIEGCFIRLVVSWEIFIEEYFLRCMCKAKTRTNKEIKPISNPSKTINDAFKKIEKLKDVYSNLNDVLSVEQLKEKALLWT